MTALKNSALDLEIFYKKPELPKNSSRRQGSSYYLS